MGPVTFKHTFDCFVRTGPDNNINFLLVTTIDGRNHETWLNQCQKIIAILKKTCSKFVVLKRTETEISKQILNCCSWYILEPSDLWTIRFQRIQKKERRKFKMVKSLYNMCSLFQNQSSAHRVQQILKIWLYQN